MKYINIQENKLNFGTVMYAAVGYADYRPLDSWTRMGGATNKVKNLERLPVTYLCQYITSISQNYVFLINHRIKTTGRCVMVPLLTFFPFRHFQVIIKSFS